MSGPRSIPHDGGVVTVDDLLAEPSLGVELIHRAQGSPTDIRWVATSELPRPDDFLTGGELLLTTGLVERSTEEWSGLVQRLAGLPLSGLCFGTGLIHATIPEGLVDAARQHQLTLMRTDVSVPFVQISQWVIEKQIELRERDARELSERQDDMVRRLLEGGDLRGVLRGMHGPVDAGRLRVIEPDGTVLARYPDSKARGHSWSADPGSLDLPIVVRGRLVARLQSERPPADDRLARFAATVLGVELARRHAWLAGSRELVGHVFEDLLDRSSTDQHLAPRLARHGISPSSDVWLVVGHVGAPPDVLIQVPGLLSPPWTSLEGSGSASREPVAAMVRGHPTVVVDGSESVASAAAEAVRERLAREDPAVGVGVSGPHHGLDGLRLGWTAAKHAATRGEGVHHAERSSVSWLLLGASEGPIRAIVDRVLGPLRSHDEAHGTMLVATVRAHLDNDGVVSAVAADLGVHPNTVRQRVRTIERLCGASLASTRTRVDLALALRAADLDP